MIGGMTGVMGIVRLFGLKDGGVRGMICMVVFVKVVCMVGIIGVVGVMSVIDVIGVVDVVGLAGEVDVVGFYIKRK